MKNMDITSAQNTHIIETKYCDACPGRARFEVVFSAGSLYFCLHHFNKKRIHFEKVMLQSFELPETH